MLSSRMRSEPWRAAPFLLPLLALLAAWFVWPLAQALTNSLHPNTPQGIDAGQWTLANYARIADPLYAGVVVRTLRISALVTAISSLLVYPVALATTRLGPRREALAILAYVSPWLVNTLVKALGWNLLLRPTGLVNAALGEIGAGPLRLMLNETGVVIALIPGHFMFVLLPVWAALKGLDPALGWAAGTLGASRAGVFWRVLFPLTLPALIAGLAINFIMNTTAFAIPMLLGGLRNETASMLAYRVNLVMLDWPFGGAVAVVLLVFTLLLVWGGQRIATLAVPGPRA